MKKGFTIIEIIISVSILLIVGISTTFFILNRKNNELKTITKQILESANLYINVEIDDTGNSFLQGINFGGAGVKIPLSKLVDKGYLSDNLITSLKKEKGNDVIENNYVLALLGDGTENNECDGITYKISWDEEIEDEIYLCKSSSSNNGKHLVIFDIPEGCKFGSNEG